MERKRASLHQESVAVKESIVRAFAKTQERKYSKTAICAEKSSPLMFARLRSEKASIARGNVTSFLSVVNLRGIKASLHPGQSGISGGKEKQILILM